MCVLTTTLGFNEHFKPRCLHKKNIKFNYKIKDSYSEEFKTTYDGPGCTQLINLQSVNEEYNRTHICNFENCPICYSIYDSTILKEDGEELIPRYLLNSKKKNNILT